MKELREILSHPENGYQLDSLIYAVLHLAVNERVFVIRPDKDGTRSNLHYREGNGWTSMAAVPMTLCIGKPPKPY